MKREKVAGKNNPMYGKKHTPEALAKMRGRKFTLEHKKRLSDASIGKQISEDARRKISIANKGRTVSEDVRRRTRATLLGSEISPERRAKISKKLKGVPLSIERRKKLSEVARRGENHSQWKGGITPINEKIRKSFEYKLWREAVFARDKYTCVWCLSTGVYLNADHIKRFSDYPELRFAIDNGRTLCVPCHKTTDTYGGKKQK